MDRVVFIGTPQFAAPSLDALLHSTYVVGVITQPDRPAGRGRQVVAPPVKELAVQYGVPVSQPESINSMGAIEQLARWQPDVIVVVAFGQILRRPVLQMPRYGCINVHASLLPRWRGAAPIAAAILAGDAETGVTIMRMDEGLDTGPILVQKETAIGERETRLDLEKRLAHLGSELLVQALPRYIAGDLIPRPQPDEGMTYAPQLRKADGRLDWTQPAIELGRQIRAFTPWPGVFTTYRGIRLKLLRARVIPDLHIDAPPGTVVALDDGVAVSTGEGALCLEEVQLASKRPMDIATFLCGQQDCVGNCLGANETQTERA
ncbi:MAG: methionyl-tRNA formyltransferase [Chloroflexi bacterium]|nr:methionyl-tRNA formyltransferase [Chloroflexota bacterium]